MRKAIQDFNICTIQSSQCSRRPSVWKVCSMPQMRKANKTKPLIFLLISEGGKLKLELTFEEISLSRKALQHYRDQYSSYMSIVENERLKALLKKFTE